MVEYKEPVENFEQLVVEIKKYLALQTEYVKADVVEKLSIILSTLLIITVVLVMIVAALFFLFFSLAYALEPVLGSLALSFAVISGIYLLFSFLFFLFRKQLVINPLVRLLSSLFLTKHNS
jgi:hypothetical protein